MSCCTLRTAAHFRIRQGLYHSFSPASVSATRVRWNILSSIPYVGYLVQIWAMPYINLSYALYYEALSGRDIYAADRGTEFPPPPVDY